MSDSKKTFAFVMPWHILERGGGAEVQANYLAQELGARGHSVAYICQTNKPDNVNKTVTIGHISVHYLKPSGRLPWMDQNKFRAPLKQIKPDYVIQRLTSNVTYVLGSYCAKNASKFVWICSDNNVPFSNMFTAKFKKRNTLKSLGLLKYSFFHMNSRFMDLIRNKGMKYIDIALSQNDFQKQHLQQNFGLNSARIISGHPIPENQISITERFNNKTVLWCANWGPHKRPELFIALARKMQNKSYYFVMVGSNNDAEYVASLLKDKPRNLTLTGKLSFEDALAQFDNASVFVNTSAPGGDGFPNTFIQSWLRNTPVISLGFDPDNKVTENNLGYVVKDIKAAEETLNNLFAYQDVYESMAKNVLEYAVQNHSLERMTESFLSALKIKEDYND